MKIILSSLDTENSSPDRLHYENFAKKKKKKKIEKRSLSQVIIRVLL
jgi:hypothetical protein